MLFDTLLDDIVIPRFVRVRDHRVAERIEDVAAAVAFLILKKHREV